MTEAEREAADRRSLEEEYKIIQGKWDDFDRRVLIIRGWFFVAMAVAIGYFEKEGSVVAPFGVIGLAAVAWTMEGIWKSWHHAYGPRLTQLEKFFAGQLSEQPLPFQINTSWRERYEAPRKGGVNWRLVWREMKMAYIWIAYLPFIVICLIFGIGNAVVRYCA